MGILKLKDECALKTSYKLSSDKENGCVFKPHQMKNLQSLVEEEGSIGLFKG